MQHDGGTDATQQLLHELDSRRNRDREDPGEGGQRNQLLSSVDRTQLQQRPDDEQAEHEQRRKRNVHFERTSNTATGHGWDWSVEV